MTSTDLPHQHLKEPLLERPFTRCRRLLLLCIVLLSVAGMISASVFLLGSSKTSTTKESPSDAKETPISSDAKETPVSSESPAIDPKGPALHSSTTADNPPPKFESTKDPSKNNTNSVLSFNEKDKSTNVLSSSENPLLPATLAVNTESALRGPTPPSTSPQSNDPTNSPTERYPYTDEKFDWKNINSWEWADGSPMDDAKSKFTPNGIYVDTTVRKTPMRTKIGWGKEKIVYIAWTANDQSDTNIWMLNMKIRNQFGANNGWPYNGEIDIFEMFTNDRILQPHYDFSGFGEFNNVNSYGQFTLHMSVNPQSAHGCFCPASPSKEKWYNKAFGMTSGCTAQFRNTPNQQNEIALVFGSEANGKYLQVVQHPKLVPGADGTYKLDFQDGTVTSSKVYNNHQWYWGVKYSECPSVGHNPDQGFPFFEPFRLIFEEQANGQFVVNDVKILTKQ